MLNVTQTMAKKSYKRLHFSVTFITLTQIPYGPVPRVASGVGEAS